ncbi:hypothetical protein PVAP13_4NG099057 [Panicum virgatum]|uniref:Uncharacterized protein n=1 Tax=Panicum virgatum TaxID=38727 RepID=A0A8T0T0C5_PANVG|nr:hypothetical protein PVAP13_4NG099057 [Panicum virgatum]
MVRGGVSARPIAVLLVRASLEAAKDGGSDIANAVALWEASPCLLETATTVALFVGMICHSACCTSSTALPSAAASSPRLSLSTVAGMSLCCLVI